jgi:mono/diheme cytochrome c family protein
LSQKSSRNLDDNDPTDMERRMKVGFQLVAVAVLLSFASSAHAADAKRGKMIYTSRCSFCHGATGKGDGPAGAALKPPPTNLTTPDFWNGATADSIKAVIENGKPHTAMVSFKTSLKPDQLDDLVAYLETFKPR